MDYFDFEQAASALPSLVDVKRDATHTGARMRGQIADSLTSGSIDENLTSIVSGAGLSDWEKQAFCQKYSEITTSPSLTVQAVCPLCGQHTACLYHTPKHLSVTGCLRCLTSVEGTNAMPQAVQHNHPTDAILGVEQQSSEYPHDRRRSSPIASDNGRSPSAGFRFPKEAVRLLKKWLSENRDCPYASEKEKAELVMATRLSRSQVLNWLANSRRRARPRPRTALLTSPDLALNIPPRKDSDWFEMTPMDRWKASPPENEAALAVDIAHAMAIRPLPNATEDVSSRVLVESIAVVRHTPSEDESRWSLFDTPSESSFNTRQSSHSDSSIGSLITTHSYDSTNANSALKGRRRRRRIQMTKSTARKAHLQKPRIYQCTFCTETFAVKYDWHRHEKSLHLALERWTCCPGGYVMSTAAGSICAFCNELDPSHEHVEFHNYWICSEKSLAERTFYRKDHLRQHLRLTHGCQFQDHMESWRSTNDLIKSRCGFCNINLESWQQRIDHLAEHFKHGSDMGQWCGDRGFDAEVEKLVENAIPAHAIGRERRSMNPYIARRTHTTASQTLPDALHNLNYTSMQLLKAEGGTVPSAARMHPPSCIANANATCEIKPVSKDGLIKEEIHANSNLWDYIEDELLTYVSTCMNGLSPCVPSDQEMQDHARTTVYGCTDPLDWTAADDPVWLSAFKYKAGIGPKPEQGHKEDQGSLQATYLPTTSARKLPRSSAGIKGVYGNVKKASAMHSTRPASIKANTRTKISNSGFNSTSVSASGMTTPFRVGTPAIPNMFDKMFGDDSDGNVVIEHESHATSSLSFFAQEETDWNFNELTF